MAERTVDELARRAWQRSDEGVFAPADMATPGDPVESIRRRLKRAGYAEPTGMRDGLMVLTRKGGNPHYGRNR